MLSELSSWGADQYKHCYNQVVNFKALTLQVSHTSMYLQLISELCSLGYVSSTMATSSQDKQQWVHRAYQIEGMLGLAVVVTGSSKPAVVGQRVTGLVFSYSLEWSPPLPSAPLAGHEISKPTYCDIKTVRMAVSQVCQAEARLRQCTEVKK